MIALAVLLIVLALCAALPNRLVAALLPLLWVLERLLPEPLHLLAQLGPVKFGPADAVVFLLLVKFAVSAAWRKELVVDRALYLALGAYVLVQLIATLAAGLKFGEEHALRCAVSWARFVSEMLLVAVIAQAVQTRAQAKLCLWFLLGTLALLAALQFVNYFGASHGFVVGEVQGIERGEVRYFGPIGDSVGMVLLLGYLAALCFASLPGAIFFLGGIVLTAGLGAIVGAVVATALFLLFGARTPPVRAFVRRGLWLLPLLVFGGLIGLALFARPFTDTLRDRLTSGTYLTSGAQRGASSGLAGAMILDNPLLGVGYMGYEKALERYGGDRYFNLNKPDGGTASANNQILQALTDGGIFGLLAFGALAVAAARLFQRIALRSDDPFLSTYFLAAFLWLLAQLFGNLAAVWLNPASFVARLLWVSLGVGVAVARQMATETPRSTASRVTITPPDPALLPA